MIQNVTIPIFVSNFLHKIILVQVENVFDYCIILDNIQLNGCKLVKWIIFSPEKYSEQI